MRNEPLYKIGDLVWITTDKQVKLNNGEIIDVLNRSMALIINSVEFDEYKGEYMYDFDELNSNYESEIIGIAIHPEEEECKINTTTDISDEKKLLEMTAELWNKFVKLEKFHPNKNDIFADKIHELQWCLSYRITVKEHPEIFPNKMKKEMPQEEREKLLQKNKRN